MALPHFNGYYLTAGLLALCTIIGMSVAVRFRREVDDDLAPPTSRDLLDPLEEAYFSGLMAPEEIERIRASVQRQQVAEQPTSTSKRRPNPSAGDAGMPIMGDSASSPASHDPGSNHHDGAASGGADPGGGEAS